MRGRRNRWLPLLSLVVLVLATGCGGGSEAPPSTVYGPTTTTLDPERPSDVSSLPLLLKELSRINVGGSASAEVTVDGRKYSFPPDPDHPEWAGKEVGRTPVRGGKSRTTGSTQTWPNPNRSMLLLDAVSCTQDP